MSDTRKISLYFTEGPSDKEYHAQMEPQGNGWVVRYQYGRRGRALKAGTKTASPVALATAAKIYDRLVNEKTRKGYTPDVGGEVFRTRWPARIFPVSCPNEGGRTPTPPAP